MKKRCLALMMAVLVAFSTIAPSTGDMQVYAAELTDEVESTEMTVEDAVEPAEDLTEENEAEINEELKEESTKELTAELSEESTEKIEDTDAVEEESTEKTGDTEVSDDTGVDESEAEETEIPETIEGVDNSEVPEETEEFENTALIEETEVVEDTEVVDENEEDEEENATEEELKIKLPTGFQDIEVCEFGEIDETQIFEVPLMLLDGEDELRSSSIYNTEWDKYSTNYYYNQLNDSQRELWDAMDELCRTYLLEKTDAEENSGRYLTQFVAASGVTREEMKALARMFRFSNPQYYFLNTTLWSATYYGYEYLGFGIYSAFADGDARAIETAKVKAKANEWLATVPSSASEGQKVKVIHDIIVSNVEYDYDNDLTSAYEETAFAQSAYSVFCMDETVCAGYSQTFEMLCNASGVDCITVTSYDHQWNKVRVNDSWYNVDCTWADQGDEYPIYYAFFARNDNYYDTAQQASSHAEEDMWLGYLPVCSLDTNPADRFTVGTWPTISKTVPQPTIKLTEDSDAEEYVATLTASLPGADIYYTLDGSAPTVAFAKAVKYTEPFYVKPGATVNAMAVCNGYFDSVTVSQSTPIVYEISYKGNGNTGGSMKTQKVTYNSGTKFTANAFKRTGYTFTGWNTKADGSGTSYQDKADASKLTKTHGKTITLYAQWKKTKYTVKYVLGDGGKNNSSNPMSYYITTSTKTLKNPTRKGYTFAGWYSDSKYKNKITQIKKGSTGNKTIYAKWTPYKYKIVFNGNGNTGGSMKALSNRKYGTSYTLTANKFKKKGYTFVGWNTKANGKGKSYDNKEKIKSLTAKNGGSVTLYAQWEKTKYTITYKLNGGTNNSKNPTKYTDTTKTIKLKNPTRKGYTFAGWYSDSKFKNKVTQIKKGSTGKKTLYAKWTVNKYKIVYDGNGSTSGKMSATTGCKYDKSYTLKANTYKNGTYTFVGWNTKKDGTGTGYKDKAGVKKLSSKANGTVTLYAQWEDIRED